MASPRIGVPGLVPSLLGQPSNLISLPAGAAYNIPAGDYFIQTGPRTVLQIADSITGQYRNFPTANSYDCRINSDGANFRLVNVSGCLVGSVITNAGTGYTNGIFVNGVSTTTGAAGITCAASAGGATFTAIVGGAVNTSATITTAGSGYTFAPILIVSAPPAGGLQATATCTISAGAINAVTITNQGAGYTTAPTVTVVNDPRDTTGSGGVITLTLTGSGTLTGLYPISFGSAQTSVPTLSFSGGGGSSAAATALMSFAATGFTVTAGGAAYGNAQPFEVHTVGGISSATPIYTNPYSQIGSILPRQALFRGTSTAGGAITATGAITVDSGLGFQAVPDGIVVAGGSALATTVGQVTVTVGGVADTSFIQPV